MPILGGTLAPFSGSNFDIVHDTIPAVQADANGLLNVQDTLVRVFGGAVANMNFIDPRFRGPIYMYSNTTNVTFIVSGNIGRGITVYPTNILTIWFFDGLKWWPSITS